MSDTKQSDKMCFGVSHTTEEDLLDVEAQELRVQLDATPPAKTETTAIKRGIFFVFKGHHEMVTTWSHTLGAA
jgi:hypothetical protein